MRAGPAPLVYVEGYKEVEEIAGARLVVDGDKPRIEYLTKWKVCLGCCNAEESLIGRELRHRLPRAVALHGGKSQPVRLAPYAVHLNYGPLAFHCPHSAGWLGGYLVSGIPGGSLSPSRQGGDAGPLFRSQSGLDSPPSCLTDAASPMLVLRRRLVPGTGLT